MKVRFRVKALDATVTLRDVPFDGTRLDDVTKALSTLAPSISEVNSIVQIKSRTDRHITFDFVGPEELLKNFFDKYYAGLTWEQIKIKFGKGSSSDSQQNKKSQLANSQQNKSSLADPKLTNPKNNENEDTFIDELSQIFRNHKYRFKNISFDKENKTIIIEDLEGKLENLLMLLYSNTKVFRRFNYEFKSVNLKNRKEIKIILDDL